MLFKNKKVLPGRSELRVNSEQGFTLIELLIVIVIISILAAILITVLDPAAQRMKARDAVVQSALNKAALSAAAQQSSYGIVPSPEDFFGGLVNASIVGSCSDVEELCNYAVDGVSLADNTGNDLLCTQTNRYATATPANGACSYVYTPIDDNSDDTYDRFLIRVRSLGTFNRYFAYDSRNSRIYYCPSNFTDTDNFDTNCDAL